MKLDVEDLISAWSEEDLINLLQILDPKGKKTEDSYFSEPKKKVLTAFRWTYYSRVRRSIKAIFKKDSGLPEAKEYPLPTYDELLEKATKKTNCYVIGAERRQLELYLIERVITTALNKMEPRERHRVLTESFDTEAIARSAKIKNSKMTGPLVTLGALAAAQASGFGIYVAATTALGFLTHAVGVTLPFAAYTGLSSTIGVIIGPIGWLGAGLWGAYVLTGPEWDKIITALVYMIHVNERTKLQ